MPIKNFPASSYVAAQVKSLRLRRGWSQERLAGRLNELLTKRPEWVERLPDDDARKPKPGSQETPPRWSQTRILKLEKERLRITVDDLVELALALDVSPLDLLTPTREPHPDDMREHWSLLAPEANDAFKVAVGEKLSFWPRNVRQWVWGVNPLLGTLDYRTNEEAAEGHRFYWAGSTSLGELNLLEEAGERVRRARQALASLEPANEEKDDAE